MSSATNGRVITYVDGFNLYFGLKAAGLRHRLWLDISKLSQHLILPSQQLVIAKYFTARVTSPAKRARQTTYLEALESIGGLEIYEGHFLEKSITCRAACGQSFKQPEEKMTDVQIATQLLVDAFAHRYDVAIIVSADGDLVPPVRALQSLFPQKRIGVAFPPKRFSNELANLASFKKHIHDRRHLRRSQLPDPVPRKVDGFPLRRPGTWV